MNSSFGWLRHLWLVSIVLVGACNNAGARARRVQESESLRRENERLGRLISQRDGTIVGLRRQIRSLEGFPPDRPAALFSPTKLVIASLSGGADYDGQPGDDGVTVHLRPVDADGDVVKAPGRITVQLLDNRDLSAPRVIGIYVFDDPKTLRKLWYGKFGTSHYTLKCPFPEGQSIAAGPIDVKVEFLDYLTGKTLSVVEEMQIRRPSGG